MKMNEEEARVEQARLRAAAADWARRLQSDPDNAFLQRQYERAVRRADVFAADELRAVVLG